MASATAELAAGMETVLLLPEDIEISADRNARGGELDTESVRTLAESIRKVGQLQNVLVENTGEGKYRLIAGHRRVMAIALNNVESKGLPVEVRCTVIGGLDEAGKEAWRRTMHENLHREDLSPIQYANDIQITRSRFGWEGSKGTRNVANFLGVSPATITTHERLLQLPDDIQAKIHKGEISRVAAFNLLDTKPEKQQTVLSKAQKKAAAEAIGVPEEQVTQEQAEEATATGAAKVTSRHVTESAREEDALVVPKQRTAKDVDAFFVQFDDPAYGYYNGAVRTFLRYFIGEWRKGTGSDKKLKNLWNEMTENADPGTESKRDQIQEPETEASAPAPKGKGKAKGK